MLVGREAECRELVRLLRHAVDGTSGALLIRGEPGLGKSALLEFAANRAQGFAVLTATGVESESELGFGALVGLCRPLLGYLDRIPEPQRNALASAMAMSTAPLIDRFSAFAAFLSLLGIAAEDRPVLVLVDDLQWVDHTSAEAMLFAARRLGPDRVALLLSSRLGEDEGLDLGGIPKIRLTGLSRQAGVRLLRRRYPIAQIPDDVAAHLVELTGGVPLALVEVPPLLSQEQLGGDQSLPQPLPVGDAVREAFRREIDALSPSCLEALRVLAADDTGSVDVLADALANSGTTSDSLEPAERTGLIRIRAGHAEFRHPLLRSVVYHSASYNQRRLAHRELARAYSASDQARCAWHLAAAASGPDESIAMALEASAEEVRARGAHASAAVVFERAAELTPDAEARARRRLEAGTAAWLGGHPNRARTNLEAALEGAADPLLRADIQAVRGRLLYLTGSIVDGYTLLVDEALRIERTAPDKAVAMLTDACTACSAAAQLDLGMEAATLATSIARRVGGVAELLAVLALAQPLIFKGRTREALRILRRWKPAAAAYFRAPLAVPFDPITANVYLYEDYAFAHQLLDTFHMAARERAPQRLPQVLGCLTDQECRRGEWALAYAHGTEGSELATVIGQDVIRAFTLSTLARVEAGMGRDDARVHAQEVTRLASRTGSRSMMVYAYYAVGLLDFGTGMVDEAAVALEETGRLMREWGALDLELIPWMPDLIEVYVHAGRAPEARQLLADMKRLAKQGGTQWARAMVARCTGLVADEFDEHFSLALKLHEALPTPFDRARTELAFAERLRRAGRRKDARSHLRAALRTFDRLGAAPWSARTEAELGSTAEHVRKRRDSIDRLSPQELQVALLVGGGATNRETAASLYVTAKTVEFHLGNIYPKLGIRSRSELARVVATQPTASESRGGLASGVDS